MKKLIKIAIPFKAIGSMLFSGFIILYMLSGMACAIITGGGFSYSLPFSFLLQGLILAALIVSLWGMLFSNLIIKKWGYFSRLIAFAISLIVLMAICIIIFIAIPTEWASLWLVTNGIVGVGFIVVTIIDEVHFMKTGKRYIEIFKTL